MKIDQEIIEEAVDNAIKVSKQWLAADCRQHAGLYV